MIRNFRIFMIISLLVCLLFPSFSLNLGYAQTSDIAKANSTMNPSNGYIYILNRNFSIGSTNTGFVAVIDPSTNNVIKNIPIGETDTLFGDLIYNPSNGYVYATSIINDTGTVSIIDSFTSNVVKIIPIGESDITLDRNLIYNPSNGYIYLSGAQKLYVIKHKEIHK
jgi:YVTN family beta-propeller protein